MGEECLHPLEGLELRGDQTLHCRCGAEFFCHSMAFMKVVRRALAPRPRAKIHDWSRVRQMDLLQSAQLRVIDQEMAWLKRSRPATKYTSIFGVHYVGPLRAVHKAMGEDGLCSDESKEIAGKAVEAILNPHRTVERLESRLEALEKRSHRLEAQLATFRQEVQGRSFRASRDPLESRLAAIEKSVDVLAGRVRAFNLDNTKRLAMLEETNRVAEALGKRCRHCGDTRGAHTVDGDKDRCNRHPQAPLRYFEE